MRQGGKEGGKEKGREVGREGGREKEGGERWREGRKVGEREGKEGGKEGEREEGREGGRKKGGGSEGRKGGWRKKGKETGLHTHIDTDTLTYHTTSLVTPQGGNQ